MSGGTWTFGELFALGTFASGTADAPTAPGDGLSLVGLGGVAVFLVSAGATDLGSVHAYAWSAATSAWVPMPGSNITVPATTTAMCGTPFTVVVPRSRICFVPYSLGANACTIALVGARALR
jgi:hypothetical protein